MNLLLKLKTDSLIFAILPLASFPASLICLVLVYFIVFENEKETKNKKIMTSTYSIYFTRFAEMLLNHFDEKIENITITCSSIKGYDII